MYFRRQRTSCNLHSECAHRRSLMRQPRPSVFGFAPLTAALTLRQSNQCGSHSPYLSEPCAVGIQSFDRCPFQARPREYVIDGLFLPLPPVGGSFIACKWITNLPSSPCRMDGHTIQTKPSIVHTRTCPLAKSPSMDSHGPSE